MSRKKSCASSGNGLKRDLARLDTTSLQVSEPVHGLGGPVFFLAYQGLNDRDLQVRLADMAALACPDLLFIAPHCRQPRPVSRKSGRLRVGFLSSNFYNHTIGKLNLGLVRQPSRVDFQVVLFRFPGPDDAPARAFQKSADQVVTLSRKLEKARQEVAEQELDILYYADIGMDALTYYLAFSRLAPVQCVTWGHPVTTGIKTMDYFLSSTQLETARSEEHYTEKLVRLERLNTYYYEPQLSGPRKTRQDFGLPESAHLYVCPQTLYKIHPEFDSLLAAILRGDPAGQVVFIEGMHPYWNEMLLALPPDHTRRGQAVPVSCPRMSGDNFLHLQNIADVLLDPIHFGGGNTSYEAFSVGAHCHAAGSILAAGSPTPVTSKWG